MRYKYVECFTIKGLVGPIEEQLIIADKDFVAYLVTNPDKRLAEIDKRMAIANLMLTSLFNERPKGELLDLIEERIDEIRKERNKKKNGYIIIEITGELSEFKPSIERKIDDLHLVFDSVNKDAIKSEYQDDIKTALITLRLISDKIIGIEKITEGLILFNEIGEKIYPFNFKGGQASMYVSSPLDEIAIQEISELFIKLKKHRELDRVVELLASSLKSSNDLLRAYLSSYTGLEIFANKLFPKFEADFFKEISTGDHPEIRGKYLDRIRTVMRDKYNILDKFSIISLRLAPSSADNDSNIFMRLKKQRDLITHGQNVSDQELDVDNAQRLLTNYLKLYLDFVKPPI